MKKRKLNRTSSHRKAMKRNLVSSLIINERVVTTQAKAKECRSMAEKVITMAKNDDQHSRMKARKVLNNKEAVNKLFEEIGPRFAERPGGYTRILKLAPRRGDAAPEVIFELVE